MTKKLARIPDPYSPYIQQVMRDDMSRDRKNYSFRINPKGVKLRYCECCGKNKPSNSKPHKKGWTCDVCE